MRGSADAIFWYSNQGSFVFIGEVMMMKGAELVAYECLPAVDLNYILRSSKEVVLVLISMN